jgi:ATP-dependent helicase/nuclease subunit A
MVPKNFLTTSQKRAVAARGNVLVMAGAGTGKTHTLVERCLNLLEAEKISIDEILIVTFTEAAAVEMRSRLRARIEEKSQSENVDFWREQLALFDLAHIGTLHSFCFALIRENFHRFGLDPQLSILDEGETFQLAAETLDEQFTAHYENKKDFSNDVQNLIQAYGNGRDEKIRELILRLHHYSQTRPDAEIWLVQQIEFFSAPEPTHWRELFFRAIENWRDEWLPVLENLKSENEKAAELSEILPQLKKSFSRESAAETLSQIISADNNWPAKRKIILRKPLEKFFAETKFLHSFARIENGVDPLAQDWDWIRGHMKALLQLAQEFAENFSARKRADGVLDFHDLEQFALKVLREPDVAQKWREKFRFIFVDEYQDINAAQDKIIQCLSGENETANRFLVGDVKQSIYRFRLADPKIFRDYAKNWRGEIGQTIPLSENFRSREPLLNFVNSLFTLLMREEIGGINYDADAHLKFGAPETREIFSEKNNPTPQTELLLRIKNRAEENSGEDSELADLEESQKEARLIAQRLQELVSVKREIWDDEQKTFRALEWRDVAILLRSPRGKAEIFAQEFARAEIPLIVARGGFFDSSEILDLLSLLELLDNPLQDVPCISVLRSPLVGLSLDELAEIRLRARGHFWFALNEIQNSKFKIQNELRAKIEKFLSRFVRWRKIAKHVSLSECLETIMAETHYDDWLKLRPRGPQRSANIAQFLNQAQRFDEFQRQGLFRFLKFIAAQRKAEIEPEVPAVAEENAVRLMSIHQSKGLEFPVVVAADLGKNFNEQDLRAEIIFDEELGLCPRVKPPQTGARYSSLPHWLAQKNQRRELRGEELRLLYVALTRARDNLILTASFSQKNWETLWTKDGSVTLQKIAGAKSFADWLGIWFAQQAHPSSTSSGVTKNETQGEFENLRWRIVDDSELSEKSEVQNSKSEIEIPALDEIALEKLSTVLNWNYPFTAATKRAAKSSVTALRREAEALDDEAEPALPFLRRKKFVQDRPSKIISHRKLSASEIGAAHHKFLELVALEKTGDLAAEAERLARENFLSAEEKSVLNLKSLAQFWNSQIGEKFAAQAQFVKRELQFTARFSPAELEKIVGRKIERGLESEFVVVQGVADLVAILPREIWLVDFKTDDFGESELPEKIKIYKPQLQLYAAALEKIYARPVTLRALHFLATQKTVEI